MKWIIVYVDDHELEWVVCDSLDEANTKFAELSEYKRVIIHGEEIAFDT